MFLSKIEKVSIFKLSVDFAYKTCKVKLIGTIILSRISQRANTASSSEFRKCKQISQIEVDRGFSVILN